MSIPSRYVNHPVRIIEPDILRLDTDVRVTDASVKKYEFAKIHHATAL